MRAPGSGVRHNLRGTSLMHDLFSRFFGPGGDEDRIFAWVWPLCVLGYFIGFGLYGAPTLWGMEVKRVSQLFMVSAGFGTLTVFTLFGLWTVAVWVWDRRENQQVAEDAEQESDDDGSL